jgi:cyclophilin family peptidyl-prolyl cis-trans isomerase
MLGGEKWAVQSVQLRPTYVVTLQSENWLPEGSPMTFRDLFARKLTRPQPRRTLWVEALEARDVPSVTLRDLPELNPNGRSLTDIPVNVATYYPITNTAAADGAVRYSVSTSSSEVTASVVTGGRSIRLTVTGKDSAGADFTGTMTIRLFEDAAPLATGTIVKLVEDGFYDGKLFHRIINDFVIQGGSPTGNGIGGSDLPDVRDEFNRDFTFSSLGTVAMANATDDNNNSQFFITDPDQTLADREQFLNFNHTIVGLLTDGFDTYQQIITTPLQAGGSTPLSPVTITKAEVFDDTSNAVVRVVSSGVKPATVTVTGTDGTNSAAETFTVTPVSPNVDSNGRTVNSRAFTGVIPDVTLATNTPGTFDIGATDVDGDTLQYAVGVPGNLFGTPASVTATVDQATGRVTVTPNSGFTGTVDLLVGVWDGVERGSGASDPSNYDTEVVRVTVQGALDVGITLSSVVSRAGIGQSVPLTATLSASSTPTGTVNFFVDGTQIGTATVGSNGLATFTTTFNTVGAKSIQARFVPGSALFNPGDSNAISIEVTEESQVVAIAADGADFGTPPTVQVTGSNGETLFTLTPYETSFTGGVRTAVADVNGDGQDDVICVPGFGGAPLIRAYDGRTGTLIRELMVFEDTFRGGLYVDVGDALGAGYSQIVVGAGFTGGPRITVFDVRNDRVIANYFAYDPAFRGGVSVDFSDLRGGDKIYLTTGPGKGGGPQVKVWDPAAVTDQIPSQVGSTFNAGDPNNTDGIRVGAGGLLGGTVRNILVGDFEPDDAPLSESFNPTEVGVFAS